MTVSRTIYEQQFTDEWEKTVISKDNAVNLKIINLGLT